MFEVGNKLFLQNRETYFTRYEHMFGSSFGEKKNNNTIFELFIRLSARFVYPKEMSLFLNEIFCEICKNTDRISIEFTPSVIHTRTIDYFHFFRIQNWLHRSPRNENECDLISNTVYASQSPKTQ